MMRYRHKFVAFMDDYNALDQTNTRAPIEVAERIIPKLLVHVTAEQTCIPYRNDRTLNHSPEKADLEARPHAALAVNGNIPALSVKDGFG